MRTIDQRIRNDLLFYEQNNVCVCNFTYIFFLSCFPTSIDEIPSLNCGPFTQGVYIGHQMSPLLYCRYSSTERVTFVLVLSSLDLR